MLNRTCELEVYPVVPFSASGGAIPEYSRLSDTIKAMLIPLPPISLRHPTPETFGDPLTIGGWLNSRDSWLHVVPVRFLIDPSAECY
jgi:hypothetical protein